jgi:Gene 25-like lysozyme.
MDELKQLGKDLKLEKPTYMEGLSGLEINTSKDMGLIHSADNVRQAILMRLNCQKGNLWAHPEYGNPLLDMLSLPMTEDFVHEATRAIKECLLAESRAELVEIVPEIEAIHRRIAFTIYYRVLNDPKPHNLVWSAKLGGDENV